MENKHYIYLHINPLKNEIFYVGQGINKRAFATHNRSEVWKRTVKKYGYIINIIETDLTKEQVNEREIFYIKKIGRRDLELGSLINFTNGGEGSVGRTPWNKGKTGYKTQKCSEETKTKIGKGNTGKIKTEVFCKKMSELKKGSIPW